MSQGWTVETLKEHLESKISMQWDAQNKALDTAITASRELTAANLLSTNLAIEKAERSVEKRFESVNEFRGQLADQQKTYITSNTVDLLMVGVNAKIQALEAAVIESRAAKKGALEGWGWAVGIIGLLALAYSLLR